MAIKLNRSGFEHAKKLILHGFEIEHDENNWNEVKPDRDDKVKFLNSHDLEEYGEWFLGVDTDIDEKDSAKFVYPTGDFNVIQKSAILAASRESLEKKHNDIKKATDELLGLF